jgi:hypothetical protein
MRQLSIISLLCLFFISAIDSRLPDAQPLDGCVPDVEPQSSYSYSDFYPDGKTRQIKATDYAVAHLTREGKFTLFGINNVAGGELRKFTFNLPEIFETNDIDFAEDQRWGLDYIALSPNHCVVIMEGTVNDGPGRVYATVFARDHGDFGYEEQEWYFVKFFKVDLEIAQNYDVEIIEKNGLTHFMVSGMDWIVDPGGLFKAPTFYHATRFSIYEITHLSQWDREHGSLPEVNVLETGGWPCRWAHDAVAFQGLGDLPAFAFLAQNDDETGEFNGSCDDSDNLNNSINIIAPTPADLEDYSTIASYNLEEQSTRMRTIESSGPKIFTTSAISEPNIVFTTVSTILTFDPVAGFNELKSYESDDYCDIDPQLDNPVTPQLMGSGQVIIEVLKGNDPEDRQTVRMLINKNADTFAADYTSYANLILGNETSQVDVGAHNGWIAFYDPTTGTIELSTLYDLVEAAKNARTTGLSTNDQQPIVHAASKTEETEIEIFPNPSSSAEVLKIRGAIGYSSATLVNTSAVSLKATPIIDGVATINVADLPSGMYVIQFMGPGKTEAKKWIKK